MDRECDSTHYNTKFFKDHFRLVIGDADSPTMFLLSEKGTPELSVTLNKKIKINWKVISVPLLFSIK